jgi:hypothetical protein
MKTSWLIPPLLSRAFTRTSVTVMSSPLTPDEPRATLPEGIDGALPRRLAQRRAIASTADSGQSGLHP